MNYRRFLELRGPLWDELEAALTAKRAAARPSHDELERLALLYRQVLHDHALAATRFPGTGAAARLHRLALEGTRALHRERRERWGFVSFFTSRFPAALRRQSASLAVVAPLFLVATLAGFALGAVRPVVGVLFLGSSAVEGLREGRLWTESVISMTPPSLGASRIATNNLAVALVAWAGGMLAGVGALYIVALNGFMLGALLAVTAHYSLAGELLEFISAHGLLELTLIVVCAGAGLAVGKAMVVAEDLPRGEVVRRAASDSLVVLLGCLPWFVVLALVEVLISPAAQLSAPLKLAAGIGLEAMFLTLAAGVGRGAS